jgi:hypothetical protein
MDEPNSTIDKSTRIVKQDLDIIAGLEKSQAEYPSLLEYKAAPVSSILKSSSKKKKVSFVDVLPVKGETAAEDYPTLDERLSRTCQPYSFIKPKSASYKVVWLTTSVGDRLAVMPSEETGLNPFSFQEGKRAVHILDLSARGREDFEFLDNSLIYDYGLNWEKFQEYAVVNEIYSFPKNQEDRKSIPLLIEDCKTTEIEPLFKLYSRWHRLIDKNEEFAKSLGLDSLAKKPGEIEWQLPAWLMGSQACKDLLPVFNMVKKPDVEKNPLLMPLSCDNSALSTGPVEAEKANLLDSPRTESSLLTESDCAIRARFIHRRSEAIDFSIIPITPIRDLLQTEQEGPSRFKASLMFE